MAVAHDRCEVSLHISHERTPPVQGLLIPVDIPLGSCGVLTIEIQPLRLDGTGRTGALMTLLLLDAACELVPLIHLPMSRDGGSIHARGQSARRPAHTSLAARRASLLVLEVVGYLSIGLLYFLPQYLFDLVLVRGAWPVIDVLELLNFEFLLLVLSLDRC